MPEAGGGPAPARTPLYRLHAELGARLTDFHGWELPLSYPEGILAEHKGCRESAGLFDVSHMGQFLLRGPDAAAVLERVAPVNVQGALGLKPGRQTYAVLTLQDGGILDDCMIARLPDGDFWMVVNAARADLDWAAVQEAASGLDLRVQRLADRALIALQGPGAAAVAAGLEPELASMYFNDVRQLRLAGCDCTVARSGYTGEDGFEISVPADGAEQLARALLDGGQVHPCGLGARDTLRLEAGLCLYGQDLDESTGPVEAGLAWTIAKARRPGGAREGGFPGAGEILRQLEQGAPRSRIGLVGQTRQPVRAGAQLWMPDDLPDGEVGDGSAAAPKALGSVTSGTFSPSLQRPIAMAYIRGDAPAQGASLATLVRGRRLLLQAHLLPFVPARHRRKPKPV